MMQEEGLRVDAAETTASTEAESLPRRGFWGWLKRLILGRNDEAEQLQAFSASIQANPDAPTAYVLRGELFLKRKQYLLAQADFEKAVQLTEQQIDQTRWGIVAQTMRDRAERGLAHVGIIHARRDA